jgi:hypothetical protein
MNQIVRQLYEHGHTGRLIAAAQGTGIVTNDCSGALEALRLLARLGDQDAATFCEAAPETGLSATRGH